MGRDLLSESSLVKDVLRLGELVPRLGLDAVLVERKAKGQVAQALEEPDGGGDEPGGLGVGAAARVQAPDPLAEDDREGGCRAQNRQGVRTSDALNSLRAPATLFKFDLPHSTDVQPVRFESRTFQETPPFDEGRCEALRQRERVRHRQTDRD